MHISTEHKERLNQLAKECARTLFDDMQDIKMRGPKFTWKNFPNMVGRIAKVSAFLIFSDEEFKKHYRNYAQVKAESYAAKLTLTLDHRKITD